MKKDDYLQSVMFAPPKQKMQIAKFDLRTQREAFTVSMEGLKGVCTSCSSFALSLRLPLPLLSGKSIHLLRSLHKPGRIENDEYVIATFAEIGTTHNLRSYILFCHSLSFHYT